MRNSSFALLLAFIILSIALLGWWSGQPSRPPTVPMMEAQKKAASPKRLPIQDTFMEAAPSPAPTLPPYATSDVTELSKLVAALKTANSKQECRRLAQAIVSLGTEDAIKALWQAAFVQTNSDLRAGLLESLDSVVDPQMITISASVLKATKEPDILDAATQLVARGADMNTVGFLTDLYSEQDSTTFQQRHISFAISEIRTEGAASALGALAQNVDHPLLAQAAALSLFNLGTPVALQQLTETRIALSNSSAPEAGGLLQAIDQLIKPTTNTASPR